eukprot:gene4913-8502_t
MEIVQRKFFVYIPFEKFDETTTVKLVLPNEKNEKEFYFDQPDKNYKFLWCKTIELQSKTNLNYMYSVYSNGKQKDMILFSNQETCFDVLNCNSTTQNIFNQFFDHLWSLKNEMNISKFLTDFVSLLECSSKWKNFKFEEESFIQNLESKIEGINNFKDSIIFCCILGKVPILLPINLNVEKLITFLIDQKSKLDILDQITSIQHIRFLERGIELLSTIESLALNFKICLCGCLSFAKLDLKIFQSDKVEFEEEFKLAIDKSRNIGRLNYEITNDVKSYCSILSSLIQYSPSYNVIHYLLSKESFSSPLILTTCITAIKSKIIDFERYDVIPKLEEIENLFQIEQLQCEELLSEFLKSKTILNSDSEYGCKIIELSTKKLILNSHNYELFLLIKSWCLNFLKSKNNNIQKFFIDLDKILRMNFLSEYLNALLDSLTISHLFLELEDEELLSVLVQLDFDSFCDELKYFIKERCICLIKEFNVNMKIEAFKIVNKKCISELKYQLLTLIFKTSNPPNEYDVASTIFKNPIWFIFFKYYFLHQFNENSTQKQSEIILEIAPIVDKTWHFLENLKKMKCSVSDLKLVIEHKENVHQILNIIDVSDIIGIDENDWKEWENSVSEYIKLTNSLQTFLTFYCGELLDDYESFVQQLEVFKKKEKTYSYIEMKKLISLFPISKYDLIWLFENKKSKFFLWIWKKAFSSFKDKLKLEEIIDIIEKIKKEWKQIYEGINDKTISFRRLEELQFYSIPLEYENELSILKRNHSGYSSKISKDHHSWISERKSLLLTFQKIYLYRNHFPSLISLVEYLGNQLNEDVDYKKLVDTHNTLSKDWRGQKLSHSVKYIDSVIFFEDFSNEQLELLKEIHQSQLIITWLKGVQDEEFEALCGLCKSYTDDARVLEALSSLISIREMLKKILYSQYLLQSLKLLINEIKSLDIKKYNGISIFINLKSNFPLLLRVFGEKTKSHGIKDINELREIIDDGYYVLSPVDPNYLYCTVNKSKKNLNDLMNLRKKITLTEIPNQMENNGELKNHMSLFLKQISLIETIRDSLEYLSSNGHFDFQENYYEKIPCKESIKKLEEKNDSLLEEINNWKQLVSVSKEKFYYLNLYSQSHILKIIKFLNTKEFENIENSLYSLLKFGNNSLQKEDVLLARSSKWENSIDLCASKKFEQLGLFLEYLFSLKDNYHLTIENKMTDQESFRNKMKKGFCIINRKNSLDVINTILTIYSLQGRMPHPEEVLLCNEGTTLDDVLIKLNLWKNANQHKRGDFIFIISNFQLLSHFVQDKIALKINNTIKESKNRNHSSLILINGNYKIQKISSSFLDFTQFVANVNLLDEKSMKYLFASISKKFMGKLYCYYSKIPGIGKSHEIMKDSFINKLNYSRISIDENSNEKSMLSSFYAQNFEVKKCYHVDMLQFSSEDIKSTIFKLIYLGVIDDSSSPYMYYRNPLHYYYFELPSFPKETTFMSYLPHNILTVQRNNFDIYRYRILNVENELRISSEYDEKTQFVCKFLKHQNSNEFRLNPDNFDVESIDDLDGDECFDILSFHLKDTTLSYSIMNKFVNLMYFQFKKFFESIFQNHVRIEGDIFGYIDFLISNSRNLSCRSVEAYDSKNYFSRFSKMKRWDGDSSPLIVFYERKGKEIEEVLHQASIFLIDQKSMHLEEQSIYTLITSGFHYKFIEEPIDPQRVNEILKNFIGIESDNSKNSESDLINYAITADNLKKLFHILLKLQCNSPVILMGGNGQGKSELFRYMTGLFGEKLHRLSINSDMTTEFLENWFSHFFETARWSPEKKVFIFFDMINNCSCDGFFKLVISDRIFKNQPIPENLKIVAACNPYDERLTNKSKIDYHKLTYYVKPISESLIEHIFDYGTLSEQVEKMYIKSILQIDLTKNTFEVELDGFFSVFTELIFHSQNFIRKCFNDKSLVSLRDVVRCIKIFQFFKSTSIEKEDSEEMIYNSTFSSNESIKKSLILSLAYSYYCRLNLDDERENYIKMISNKSLEMNHIFDLGKLFFYETLMDEQEYYTNNMHFSDGISMNDSLRENLFMILVSILNKVPIIVAGKSGTSKSLAMDILATNLQGTTSRNSFLKKLPAIEIFSYQCSSFSNIEGITRLFEIARTYQKNAPPHTLVVVLLNEIGLLEKLNPLKVLQEEFDDRKLGKLSVVGLSNSYLDASDINRAVLLSRTPPKMKDLKKTVENMTSNIHLNSSLANLAKSFIEVYQTQKIPDFFALRDFYSMIKYINRNLVDTLSPEILRNGIMRNFGGMESNETTKIVKKFFVNMGISLSFNEEQIPILNFVKDNLIDQNARNLMLLTKNHAALHILLDKVFSKELPEIIFGSEFPKDKSELSLLLNLQRIKNCMEKGKTVILLNCDGIFECLYDLFNMQYMESDGQRFVKLAVGTYSKTCVVHQKFRIILIVDKQNAYSRLTPPLLNRFEKQLLLRKDILNSSQILLEKRIIKWVNHFSEKQFLDRTFVGYNSQYISSLVNSLGEKKTQDELFEDAIDSLLWLCTADGILRSKSKFGDKFFDRYFKDQSHNDIVSFLQFTFENQNQFLLDGQFKLEILTYSPSNVLESSLKPIKHMFSQMDILKLNNFSTESEFKEKLSEFFFTEIDDSALLVIQGDTSCCSMFQILHAKYLCESRNQQFLKNFPNRKMKNIIFVIHIHPKNEQFSQYSLDFNCRWKSIFLDDIFPYNSSTYTVLNASVEDFLTSLHVRQIIRDHFRKSLSIVKYPEDNLDVSKQIQRIERFINSDDFWSHLEPILLSVTCEYFGKENSSYWSEKVAKENYDYLILKGNFREAIMHCISLQLAKVFARLLCDIDRNSNLSLIDLKNSENPINEIWYKFWNIRESEYSKIWFDNLNWEMLKVPKDGIKSTFKAKFPFSYFICKAINNLKRFSDDLTSLTRHIDVMFPGVNVLPRNELLNYLHDFICIFGPLSEKLGEEELLKITLIIVETQSTVKTLSEIQYYLWKEEKRLLTYYILFDSDLSLGVLFTSKLKNQKFNSMFEIDLFLFDIMREHYNPLKMKNFEIESQKLWIDEISEVRLSMEKLASLSNECDKIVQQKWKNYLFFQEFLLKYGIPLKLTEKSLNFWKSIHDIDLSSKEGYSIILSFMKSNPFPNGFCDLLEFYFNLFTSCSNELSREMMNLISEKSILNVFDVKISHNLKKFILKNLVISKQFDEEIENIFEKEFKMNSEFNDNSFILCFVEIYEQMLSSLDSKKLVNLIKKIDPEIFDKFNKGIDLLSNLKKLASIKVGLSFLLSTTIQNIQKGTSLDFEIIEYFQSLFLNPKLEFLKLNFIRYIFRFKGMSFLLQKFGKSKEILTYFPWISDLLNGITISNQINGSNLFDSIEDLSFYSNILEISIKKGNNEDWNELCKDYDSIEKKYLFLSIFKQIYLKNWEEEKFNEKNIKKILDSFRNSNSISTQERTLFTCFVQNRFLQESQFLNLGPSASSEKLSLIHLIGHVISFSIHTKSIDPFFHNLLFNPRKLENCYFPSMPEDEKKSVLLALGNLYQCENGHSYNIDSCGKPTQLMECPECGCLIGGLNHELLPENSKTSYEKLSPKGYAVLLPNDESDIYSHQRNLSPISYRILRFLIHTLLFIGSSVFDNFEKESEILLNSSYKQTSQRNSFYFNHMISDWKILCELFGKIEEKLIVIMFHLLENYPIFVSNNINLKLNLKKERDRFIWEERFQNFLNLVLTSENQLLSEYYLKKTESDVNSILSEITKIQKKKIFPIDEIDSSIWNYSIPISISHFKKSFQLELKKNKYKVLNLYLNEEKSLKPTYFIPVILKWFNLVTSSLSRKIDRNFARKYTIREFLDEKGDEKMEELFKKYKKVFNHCWPLIKYYKCFEIPDYLKNFILDENSPISFCISGDKDEFICASALIEYLVLTVHNSFIEKISNIKKIDQHIISSNFTSINHTIPSNNIEKELKDILFQKSKVNYSDLGFGMIKYDFKNIENFIFERFLRGKPLIKLELFNFTFLNEEKISGSLAIAFKEKIKQEEISYDTKMEIIKSLNTLESMRSCLSQIQECISFILSTFHSKKNVSISIFDYVKNSLLITKENSEFTKIIFKRVQLKHLLSLWSLLESQIATNPLIEIRPKYKIKIPSDLRIELVNLQTHFDLEIISSTIYNFMKNYLTDDHLSDEIPLKMVLSEIEIEDDKKLIDFSWFHYFPDSILISHIFEVYKILKE